MRIEESTPSGRCRSGSLVRAAISNSTTKTGNQVVEQQLIGGGTVIENASAEAAEWRKRARAMKQESKDCQDPRKDLVELGERLEGIVFRRKETYQMDRLYLCPSCDALWLQQYWEEFDEDHQFAEFDQRFEVWTQLTIEDVDAMADALESGALLEHRHFLS